MAATAVRSEIAVVSEAPPFWWHKADWRAWALYPVSRLYAPAARHRLETAERHPRSAAPVLCVGNFTVGGAGRTPVAITPARQAQQMESEARLPVARLRRPRSMPRIWSMQRPIPSATVGDETARPGAHGTHGRSRAQPGSRVRSC